MEYIDDYGTVHCENCGNIDLTLEYTDGVEYLWCPECQDEVD